MSLKFYFDTHIAKAAAVQLRNKGVDVVRCEEVNMAEAEDEAHLQFAADNERIMVSQDEDFPILNSEWRQQGRRHAGIMYLTHPLQGEAQISHIVKELLFYDEAERGGAIDYETEIENQTVYF